mgnify:CR=1 FL=1
MNEQKKLRNHKGPVVTTAVVIFSGLLSWWQFNNNNNITSAPLGEFTEADGSYNDVCSHLVLAERDGSYGLISAGRLAGLGMFACLHMITKRDSEDKLVSACGKATREAMTCWD